MYEKLKTKAMIKPGHIRINKKVYFEYYELPRPYANEGAYFIGNIDKAFKRHEASKQLIEVENETYSVTNTTNGIWILLEKIWKVCKDGQSCKAEIKNNKATIVEIV